MVSVPSTGRSGLQPLEQSELFGRPLRFQYPLRVEVGCNPSSLVGGKIDTAVSVPSTGRSGLQPQMIRNGYNGDVKVSVPSTGRSGLQPSCNERRTLSV